MAENAPGWGGLYNSGTGIQGGFGGTSVEYSTWSSFIGAIQTDDENFNNSPKTYIYTGSDVTLGETQTVNIKGLNRKTLLFATGQTVSRGQITFKDCSDLIIRNWTRRGPYYPHEDYGGKDRDYFTCNSCQGMWFHYLDMDVQKEYDTNGGEYADGMIDTNLSDYLSVSHCRFWNGQRAMLIGYSDTQSANDGLLNTTIAYCWFKDNAGRQPKCRFGKIQLLNSVFEWDPEWDLASPRPSSSHMIGVDAKSQIYAQGCLFTGGDIFRRDEDGLSTVTSGLKFDNCTITNFVSTSLGEIRPENVTWNPNTESGYVYIEALMTPAESETYVKDKAGAKWHLQSGEDTYSIAVNDPLNGSVEVSPTGLQEEGTTITLTATPDSGYEFDRFEVSGGVGTLLVNPDTFSMPAQNVTVDAFFTMSDPPAPELAAHWKMNEGSGSVLLDETANNNDATIQNTSGVTWLTGIQGQAILFTGSLNRFATVPHNASVDITEAITVCAFIKPDGLKRKNILAKDGAYEIATWEDGKIQVRFNRGSSGAIYNLFSVSDYPIDTWLHIGWTYDGETSKIYIDGIEDNSSTYSPTPIDSNTVDVEVGAKATNNRIDFPLDELRLYNYALNDSEMLAIAAEFDPEPTYTITLVANPSGYGTLEQSPSGPHNENDEAILTATPESGKQFVGWYDGVTLLSTNNPYAYTVSSDITITGEFEDTPIVTYTLTLDVEPDGYGTAEQLPEGPHEEGVIVELTATPASGKQFVGWYDGVTLLSTNNPYDYTTGGSDKTLAAEFEDIPTFTISLSETGNGIATETSTGPYEEGNPVELRASPDSGWEFVRWEEDSAEVSTSANYNFNMPANNRTLVAIFEESGPVSITSSKNPSLIIGNKFITDGSGRSLTI